MASVVSAVIAGLTIFGKAIFKRYSMENCNKVILILGKCLSIFSRNKKDKKRASKKDVLSNNNKAEVKVLKVDSEGTKGDSSQQNPSKETNNENEKITD